MHFTSFLEQCMSCNNFQRRRLKAFFLYNFYFKKLVIITIRLTRITQFLSKLILSVLDISPDLVSMKSLVLADLNWPCHRDERKFIIQAFNWSRHPVQQSYELISQIKDVNSNRRHRSNISLNLPANSLQAKSYRYTQAREV